MELSAHITHRLISLWLGTMLPTADGAHRLNWEHCEGTVTQQIGLEQNCGIDVRMNI